MTQSGQDAGSEPTNDGPRRTRRIGSFRDASLGVKRRIRFLRVAVLGAQATPSGSGTAGVADGDGAPKLPTGDPERTRRGSKLPNGDPERTRRGSDLTDRERGADKTRLGVYERRPVADETCSGASGTRFVALKGAPALCQSPLRAHKTRPRASGTTGVAYGQSDEASDARFQTDETTSRAVRSLRRRGRRRRRRTP